MFKRRHPRKSHHRLREALWPTMGIERLTRYYRHRIGRLPGTPGFIATGFACGVAISFTPLIGLHLLLGVLSAFLLRGSLVAMVIGTVLAGNPWTFPPIWIATYKLGHFFLGHMYRVEEGPEHVFSLALMFDEPQVFWSEYLLPMLLGSVPFSLLFGLLGFYVCRRAVEKYKQARKVDAAERKKRKASE